jgi:hypothetical protein
MSEQLANRIFEREERAEIGRISSGKVEQPDDLFDACAAAEPSLSKDVTDCTDDFLIAQMLQVQFDQVDCYSLVSFSGHAFLKLTFFKEYNEALEKEASHVNGQNKVTISYSKYKKAPTILWDDDSDDGEDDELWGGK